MAVERGILRIDASLMRSLESEAKRQRRAPSRLAAEAIEAMLLNCAEKRAAINAAITEAETGSFVSEKVMSDWVASWGCGSESPAPRQGPVTGPHRANLTPPKRE